MIRFGLDREKMQDPVRQFSGQKSAGLAENFGGGVQGLADLVRLKGHETAIAFVDRSG